MVSGSGIGRAAAVAVVVCGVLAVSGPVSAAPAFGGATGGYIVVLHDSVDGVPAVARAQAARYGGTAEHVYQHALKGYSVRLTAGGAAALSREPSVAEVFPDGEVRLAAQTLPTGVDRVDGELSSAVSGNGAGAVNADIAIIDTGVGPHPDLNVVGGTNCSIPGGSFDDDNGHGTHVAGIAAAKDDANGVVGVAPGARIWSVKVLNAAGSGTFAGIICGVDWVTARAATIEVANMSISGSGANDTCAAGGLHAAICRSVTARVPYTVAAGNTATDASTVIPATYEEVITVAAIADFNGLPGGGASPTCRADVDDTTADFSNYGPDIDLHAPGVCILSTARGGGLAVMSGTSMASAHAAGAAALYRSVHPTATPAEVKAALQAAARPGPWPQPLVNVDTF
jgi:subtilisin